MKKAIEEIFEKLDESNKDIMLLLAKTIQVVQEEKKVS